MSFSIDLILIIVNLLALAFSYGKFSEKISTIEKKLSTISDFLIAMDVKYYTVKEGTKIEGRMDAMWNKMDTHPCLRCLNFKESKS